MMAYPEARANTYDEGVEAPPDDQVVALSGPALARLLEVRDREPDAADLGLAIRITGVADASFTYEMAFMRTQDAGSDDFIQTGDLPIVIPTADVENLRGAELIMSRDLLNPGFTLENPNSPSPKISHDLGSLELTGETAEQVLRVVEDVINPAIAAHGGVVSVVGVEEGTVYIQMAGGCQGCGMASVTLSQGIESTLRDLVPEVTKVVDVTDHAAGSDPYYEQAKK